MNRDYNNGVKDDVVYFTGFEVEKTPVHGEHTLFVVGAQDPKEVIDRVQKESIEHVYLGANHSFNITLPFGTKKEQTDWDKLITELLKLGIWVTLDYDVKYHEFVLESGYNENDKFISMISVKLPHIDQLNYNACIKIDDKDFKASNAGVWVHYARDLQPREKFTSWEKYENDSPISIDIDE
jgi:hypothetical protein|tara:strand:- start:1547 stop:2092 length:546 start_codon:yes stop_codon:yes gene_type:complete